MFKTLFLVAILLQSGDVKSFAAAPGDDVEIKVFFVNPKIANGNDCDTGEFVTRKIPKTTKVADAALRQLFAGPTGAEKQKGMEGIASLGSYYIGVTIKNGKAIVNFKPGAEKYLYVDGPFCMQSGVLTPISKTLTQFSSVKDVDFAINGKIIEDWDA